jgi:hypothetical protein
MIRGTHNMLPRGFQHDNWSSPLGTLAKGQVLCLKSHAPLCSHCYSVWKFWSSSFTTNKRETDFCSSIFSSVQVECLKLWLIFFLYVGTGSVHCDYCWQWGIRAVDNQVWPALLQRNICLTSQGSCDFDLWQEFDLVPWLLQLLYTGVSIGHCCENTQCIKVRLCQLNF